MLSLSLIICCGNGFRTSLVQKKLTSGLREIFQLDPLDHCSSPAFQQTYTGKFPYIPNEQKAILSKAISCNKSETLSLALQICFSQQGVRSAILGFSLDIESTLYILGFLKKFWDHIRFDFENKIFRVVNL